MLLTFPKRPRHLHARASEDANSADGYRSGLNSCRETPVARSIESTNSPGTPFLDRTSQYQTCDCVVPIRSAKGFCPPAASQARLSAVCDMRPTYRQFGESQPKTLCETPNRIFGRLRAMNSRRFNSLAERLKHRMDKLGIGQSELARRTNSKQQTIGSILKGKSKIPRILLELADALETTPEWLKDERGPEVNHDLATRRIVIEQLQVTADAGIFPEILRLMEARRGKQA